MRKPLITAHTGCLNTPPNSIASMLAGLKSGADLVEVDVRVTADGVVVLLHDEHVSGSNGSKGRVQDMTFEELSRLAGEQQIVRLDEVLPLVREAGRSLNLDVKEVGAVDPMIRIVEKHNMRDASIISGCGKEWAAYVKDRYRPYQVLLNASAGLFRACGDDYESFVKETCRDATSSSCCGINIHYRYCREELLDYAGRRCLPVLVWTVDEPSEMEKVLGMGVHSITSKNVLALMELRDRG